MSAELAKSSRERMKEKARSLATADPHQRVDASSWTPPEPLNADKQTGMRVLSKRAYKRGGKVHGEHEAQRADRGGGDGEKESPAPGAVIQQRAHRAPVETREPGIRSGPFGCLLILGQGRIDEGGGLGRPRGVAL